MKDNGGYVYPFKTKDNPREIEIEYPGITRRDWLAGLAMQALISGPINLLAVGEEGKVDLTSKAYQIADDMIEEGKK